MRTSVIPLISLWEEFSSTKKNATEREFAEWLLKNESIGNESGLPDFVPSQKNGEEQTHMTGLDDMAQVMVLIPRIHRYMQIRVKPIIKKLGFAKEQEYGMLTHIYLLKSPNKKELARQMLLETTTAVEISNRLLNKGFIKEIDDVNDKRSTRIGLTSEGEKILFDSYIYLRHLPASFLECLTADEVKQLLSLLKKVEEHQAAVK
jgi:DNA-binding MarR family transcriptional regulator